MPPLLHVSWPSPVPSSAAPSCCRCCCRGGGAGSRTARSGRAGSAAHLLPPAWLPGGDRAFPLGTDSLGRCTLSQLLFGARVAMKVAIAAASGAALIGSILALLAGYFGARSIG